MQTFDLEVDLINSELITEKCKNQTYAQNLYAALCNVEWQKTDVMPILKSDAWGVSWRSAGRIIATIRDCGEDYMDWYCSGIGKIGDYTDHDIFKRYCAEGQVTNEIREDLKTLGWHVFRVYE